MCICVNAEGGLYHIMLLMEEPVLLYKVFIIKALVPSSISNFSILEGIKKIRKKCEKNTKKTQKISRKLELHYVAVATFHTSTIK